jgi:hypothetical protein
MFFFEIDSLSKDRASWLEKGRQEVRMGRTRAARATWQLLYFKNTVLRIVAKGPAANQPLLYEATVSITASSQHAKGHVGKKLAHGEPQGRQLPSGRLCLRTL